MLQVIQMDFVPIEPYVSELLFAESWLTLDSTETQF